MLRPIALVIVTILAASPAVAQSGGEFKPTNGVGPIWMITILSLVGALFPDIADGWVEFGDRKMVRGVSAMLAAIGATLLADHYLDLDLLSIVFR